MTICTFYCEAIWSILGVNVALMATIRHLQKRGNRQQGEIIDLIFDFYRIIKV
ncbi:MULTISPECIES: hypothetical protein [Okeania]|uniref:hypothetical protein n=1 Tax=Okeania TaxID=1458928 RepID=UPI0013749A02|nr:MULTISPECIES: hypothetical protein [unclassified Okeania]NET14250.1 hypothetical protein [Okeania sp. SIO1H6]NET21392.1 hypothetical protein [Okeania sp. SIO1H5]NET77220.1 hypothetical protein [Okeania sp. SIO1F9]NET93944.1 hypothetical protein [Okeania sp. SIO1H2]